MTDEELIARLRAYAQIEHASAPWGFAGEGEVLSISADRIEALVKERDYWIERCGRERAFASSHRIRAERLEAAMQKAIMLAEQPHYGDRDDALDHCFDAIDVLRAALKGADHE